mgnify:FL=1
MGLLAQTDRAALTIYCQAWDRWLEAEAELKKHGLVFYPKGKGFPIRSPYLTIANQAIRQIQAFLAAFGCSPSSRSRIQVQAATIDDPFEKFLLKDK